MPAPFKNDGMAMAMNQTINVLKQQALTEKINEVVKENQALKEEISNLKTQLSVRDGAKRNTKTE